MLDDFLGEADSPLAKFMRDFLAGIMIPVTYLGLKSDKVANFGFLSDKMTLI